MTIFETSVTAIGPEAELFRSESMIILFGDKAPDMLADMCYTIIVNPINEEIKPGQTIYFDHDAYPITAVGSVAQKNLASLGHITVKFDGKTDPELPGTIHVKAKDLPKISVGTHIVIQ
ncbi:PTS glucitol/sorbitol transporter subunit IIA [Streptococcus rifensis]